MSSFHRRIHIVHSRQYNSLCHLPFFFIMIAICGEKYRYEQTDGTCDNNNLCTYTCSIFIKKNQFTQHLI